MKFTGPILAPEANTAGSRPVSLTTTWINLVALGSLALALLLLEHFEVSDRGYRIVAVLIAIAGPVLLLERIFTSIGLRGAFKADWTTAKILRVATKLLGIITSWLLLVLVYWIFPYFRDHSEAVYRFLDLVWFPALVLAPIYVWYVDGLTDDSKDEYLEVGRLVTGRWNQIDGALLMSHVRAWLVKLFFLQFVFHALADRLNGWLTADLHGIIASHAYGFLDVFFNAMYLIDIAFAAVGYLLTLRLFDTHVRTTEPTMLGWVVCLICYPPFYSTIDRHFIQYDDSLYWSEWLANYPTIKIIWAAMIMICIGVFALATVQLGIRFGNLSHRGIVTNGLYGWLKHPAYVSKNASWWLISIPFVSTSGTSEAIRLSLMLVCLNSIYYLRAKTEERHLSWDPVYREYVEWIRHNGLAAQLKYAGRVIGFVAIGIKQTIVGLPTRQK